MARALAFLAFEDWVRFVFDHPASGPQWYGDPDAPYWTGPPALTIDYVTRLFEAPCAPLAAYADAQLGQGFWYLLSNGASDCMLALNDASVPVAARARCLRSFLPVFRDLLAARCTPHLSHLDEPGTGALNSACYMWWDLLPFGAARDDATGRTLGATALEVMADVLALDAIACQESALHGLGHWQPQWPDDVARIVDAFLGRTPDDRPELVAYARAARCGCVQ